MLGESAPSEVLECFVHPSDLGDDEEPDEQLAEGRLSQRAAQEALEYAPHRVDVEITVAKDRPAGTVALRGARLITMRGDDVIELASLFLETFHVRPHGATFPARDTS